MKSTILSAHGLRKEYGTAAALVRAVDDVSLTVAQGESVAIVGPSGCGKSTLLYLLGAILAVLAAINSIFTTWVTVIDAQRPTALSRALGATPRQVSAGMTASQLLPALIGACLGIPAGLALYDAGGGGLSKAAPPILWLLAVIPGTLIVIGALTAIPARLGATRSPAEVLRSD